MIKKIFTLLIFSIFLISILPLITPVGEISYCCEKTKTGVWCQNSPESECNPAFLKTPSSCESTSYCKLGCCFDSQEGTCMENSPQKTCEEGDGVWASSSKCEIPQCTLGCCLIGSQAAFVTQTRCKKLSALYGLETNFVTNIADEFTCIASAMSEAKGACVYEEEFEKTCKFETKKECDDFKAKSANATGVEFHEGYLCSDEALGTNCGPSEKTTCIEERDEVYFLDTCGNLANIYDSSKFTDDNYWSKIKSKGESCSPDSSNANSKDCGNCDYYLGSVCKKYKSSINPNPDYGDNICADLSCQFEGETYQHGETWCADAKGNKDNLPGSRYFRLVCYNGDVTVESCADFRQEICIQDDINGFKTAACRANKWQDCYSQSNAGDCNNEDKRDCKWIGGTEEGRVKCVPKFAPGFNFWETEGGDAQSLCSQASVSCTVKYEKKMGKQKTCISGCDCTGGNWQSKMASMCGSIGDCGSKSNYLGG